MTRYLILYKLKFYLKRLKNPWKIILSLFLVLTAWLYGPIGAGAFNVVIISFFTRKFI